MSSNLGVLYKRYFIIIDNTNTLGLITFVDNCVTEMTKGLENPMPNTTKLPGTLTKFLGTTGSLSNSPHNLRNSASNR